MEEENKVESNEHGEEEREALNLLKELWGKRLILVKYTDDNGEEQESLHSLEEVGVMLENWADHEQKLPKNLRIQVKPLSSS